MPTRCVLAIDLGTQTARAALVDFDGGLVASASGRIDLATPRSGWAEQDPEQWWSTTVANIAAICGRNPAAEVAAVAVGAQMHSIVPLDRTGAPLARRVGIWSDKRAAALVERFAARPEADRLCALAGNVALPAWAGFKIAWYREEEPDLYAQARSFLAAKDFLNLRLCGEFATDPSEASGTFLSDATTGEWSPELIEALGLDASRLPPIVASAAVIGGILPEVARATGIPAGTPVVAGGGDMLCQLLAAGLTRRGRLVEVAGTASIVAAYAEGAHLDPRVMSLRTVTGGWVNFGIGDGVGACLPWLADHLCDGIRGAHPNTPSGQPTRGASVGDPPADAPQRSPLDLSLVDEAASRVAPGSDGLLFFPYPLGERTLGSAHSRSSFVGLTLQHRFGHLARAVMEGICFENRRSLDLLSRLDDEGVPEEARRKGPAVLYCTGGGAQSAVWNQIRADIYERPVQRLATLEGGIQGAALLAGVGAGWYPVAAEADQTLATLGPRWQPDADAVNSYRPAYASFSAVHDSLQPHWGSWCR